MPIAYSYIRMSTKAQERGNSLSRQLEAARRWAEAHGYTLDETLRDIGVSAHRGKHRTEGALAGFLQQILSGLISSNSVLLIENIDRLSREPVLTAFDTFRAILQAGVGVVLLDMGWHLSEAELNKGNSWQLQPLLSMMQRAHNESEVKSQRGLAAMDAKRQRAVDGTPFCKTGPGWLVKSGNRWVEDKLKADLVRLIFDLALDGWGAHKISVELNRLGHRPFGRARYWGSSYISKILKNEAVIGIWQPHSEGKKGVSLPVGASIPNHFPVVVESSKFLQVRREVAPKSVQGSKGKHFKNLFTGRCRCSLCGDAMHVFTVTKKGRSPISYLICSNKARKRGCNAERNLRYDIVENSVLKYVHADLSSITFDAIENKKLHSLQLQLGNVEIELRVLTQARENLANSLERASSETLPYLLERLNKKSAEIAGAEAQREILRADAARARAVSSASSQDLTKMQAKLAAAVPAERYKLRSRLARLLNDLVFSIEFNPTTNIFCAALRSTEHLFTGDGEFKGVRLPKPSLEMMRDGNGNTYDLNDWRELAGHQIIEEPESLLFPNYEDAVQFHMAHFISVPSAT